MKKVIGIYCIISIALVYGMEELSPQEDEQSSYQAIVTFAQQHPEQAAHVIQKLIHDNTEVCAKIDILNEYIIQKNTDAQLAQQEYRNAFAQAKQVQADYQRAKDRTIKWNHFVETVHNGFELITWAIVGYNIIAIHNEVCNTDSNTFTHHLACNPLGL